jgi:mannitol/fructose-specific phosphotransferase system IIA component (Ntr-type)
MLLYETASLYLAIKQICRHGYLKKSYFQKKLNEVENHFPNGFLFYFS